MSAAGAPGIPVRRVERRPRWRLVEPSELWCHRELLGFLIWKDIVVRYKQTVLGAAWAVLQPVLTMAIFAVVFGRLARLPSDGVPYPLFAYAALVPWTFFSRALTAAPATLVATPDLIRKVYFPRYLLPASSVLGGTLDFLLASAVLLALLPAYDVALSARALLLPLFFAIAVLAAIGVSLWLSALNVRYRDVRHTLPFLAQVWMLASPIAYPSSLVPAAWRPLHAANPMVGVVEGFRWALCGTGVEIAPLVAVSALSAAALALSGLAYFRAAESSFPDVL